MAPIWNPFFMTDIEFARKVMADTGKSIHQIELEIAANVFWTHVPRLPIEAWRSAQEFMEAMKEVYEERYGQRHTDIEDQPSESN